MSSYSIDPEQDGFTGMGFQQLVRCLAYTDGRMFLEFAENKIDETVKLSIWLTDQDAALIKKAFTELGSDVCRD